MPNTQNQKQRQFGFTLLMIALIVVIIFSYWYWSEKSTENQANQVKKEQQDNKIFPADDLSELHDSYLNLAKKVMTDGYGNVMLASNFRLTLGWREEDIKLGTPLSNNYFQITDLSEANNFWKNLFTSKFGQIDENSAQYEVIGNAVKINFTALKNTTDSTNNSPNETKTEFYRTITFGNYEKDQRTVDPAILEDVLEYKNLDFSQVKINKSIGDSFQDKEVEMVKNNQLIRANLFAQNGQWKLLYFYNSDFKSACTVECLVLYNKMKELNTAMYVISVDPISEHQAYEKMFFGSLPFALVSDYDKGLVSLLGIWNAGTRSAENSTVILNPENQIKYFSVLSPEISRNPEEIARIIKALQK